MQKLIDFLTRLADELRSVLGISDRICAPDFPEKISAVYEKGLADGKTDLTELLDTQNDFITYQGYDDMLHLAVGEDGKAVFNKVGYRKIYNVTTGISEYITGYMPFADVYIKGIKLAEGQSLVMTLYEEIGGTGYDVLITDIGTYVEYGDDGNISYLAYTLDDPFAPEYKYMRLHFADYSDTPIIAVKKHTAFDGETDIESAVGNVPRVYGTGFEAGRESYYDEFWDNFQNYGNADDYYYAFSGHRWNAKTFKPKYNIKQFGQFNNVFFAFNNNRTLWAEEPVDLNSIFSVCGVIIDLSETTNMLYSFQNANISSVPEILLGDNVNALNATFSGCKRLETIPKLGVSPRTTYSGAFSDCTALANITFEGDIGNNIDFKWSPLLSKASIESIVSALYAEATGKALTLSGTAVNNAFETEEGLADGSTSAQWAELVGTKPNWTISLI